MNHIYNNMQKINIIKIPEEFGLLVTCPVAEKNYHIQHETAHCLLKHSLQHYAKQNHIIIPEKINLIYQEYGKPSLQDYPDIKFNLSHCDSLAVCLISYYECGVDVEAKRLIRANIVKKIFTTEEQNLLAHSENPDWLFTKIWTLKESYVKAIGRGIGFPMQKVSFLLQEENIICNQKQAKFYQVLLEKYVISICILDK